MRAWARPYVSSCHSKYIPFHHHIIPSHHRHRNGGTSQPPALRLPGQYEFPKEYAQWWHESLEENLRDPIRAFTVAADGEKEKKGVVVVFAVWCGFGC